MFNEQSASRLWENLRVRILSLVLRISRDTTASELPSAANATSEEVNAKPWTTTARHVAIIMDGNRRFGKAKYSDALKGHWDGGQTLVDCVQWCMEFGVEHLTVYAFSTENWRRPPQEVNLLMDIFLKYSARCEEEAEKHDIRVRVLCNEPEKLPPAVAAAIARLEAKTANNGQRHEAREGTENGQPRPPQKGLSSGGGEKQPSKKKKKSFQLNLCVSYGSRGDLALAAKKCCEDVASGALVGGAAAIDEGALLQRLASSGIPNPDVLLRTSGERRLSNFLLFEAAYAELFFVDKYWPELTKQDLRDVLEEYEHRSRRFGS